MAFIILASPFVDVCVVMHACPSSYLLDSLTVTASAGDRLRDPPNHQSPKRLTTVRVGESPFYIAMLEDDDLADKRLRHS